MSNPFGGSSGGAAQPAPRPVQVCNAASAQSFVGKSNTSATLEAARKQSGAYMARVLREGQPTTMEFNQERDRKSTRLNSSHSQISYAVFCLKKKKKKTR